MKNTRKTKKTVASGEINLQNKHIAKVSNHEQNLYVLTAVLNKMMCSLMCAISFHGDQLQNSRRVLGVSS